MGYPTTQSIHLTILIKQCRMCFFVSSSAMGESPTASAWSHPVGDAGDESPEITVFGIARPVHHERRGGHDPLFLWQQIRCSEARTLVCRHLDFSFLLVEVLSKSTELLVSAWQLFRPELPPESLRMPKRQRDSERANGQTGVRIHTSFTKA